MTDDNVPGAFPLRDLTYVMGSGVPGHFESGENRVPISFRPHRSTLAEAMALAVTVPDLNALMAYLRTVDTTLGPASLIEFSRYGGDDDRIGWKDVHIVTIGGAAIGFCTFEPVKVTR